MTKEPKNKLHWLAEDAKQCENYSEKQQACWEETLRQK